MIDMDVWCNTAAKVAKFLKMNTGDWIIYYSPKMNFKESTPHQKFTALGKVVDNNIF
jgi:hypothetical protein